MMLVRGIEDSLLKTNKKAQSQITMLCIRASGVSLVTKTRKDTSDLKSHLSSLTVFTTNPHVSTVVTAQASDAVFSAAEATAVF